jgi:hypothetical protein
MERPEIHNHDILKYHLQMLEAQEKHYRELLLRNASDVAELLHDPVPVIKRTVRSIAADGDLRSDLLKTGLNLAGNMLHSKITGGSAVTGIVSLLLNRLKKARGKKKE